MPWYVDHDVMITPSIQAEVALWPQYILYSHAQDCDAGCRKPYTKGPSTFCLLAWAYMKRKDLDYAVVLPACVQVPDELVDSAVVPGAYPAEVKETD